MKNLPPSLPGRASYGWIWDYVKTDKPLTVGNITFFKIKTTAWMEEDRVRIPVLESEGLYRSRIQYFDPNPISHGTVFTELNRYGIDSHSTHESIREAIQKAEKTHKKEWLAKRAAMRKAYIVWAEQNPGLVKELEEHKVAKKNLRKTEAIIEFSKSLTLCRSKIEQMLSALNHGTYTGKMCASLYEACNEVSSAQKHFRKRACKD